MYISTEPGEAWIQVFPNTLGVYHDPTVNSFCKMRKKMAWPRGRYMWTKYSIANKLYSIYKYELSVCSSVGHKW
jgi:hypothetical protein